MRSQAALAGALAEAGFETTQATVSRDLRDLGAVKIPDPQGGSRYALPDQETDPGGKRALVRTLAEFAQLIVAAGNLVVIKTPPGAAQVVAGAVDHAGVDGVIGTVAGDDTLFIAVTDEVGARRVAAKLESMGDN